MPQPNFLLIGAQKCGTEALYNALRQHPDIFMSPNKEPFFFVMDGRPPEYRIPSPGYARWLVWEWERYLGLFEGAAGQKAIGEASAIYLSSYFPERTAERIRRRLPGARLIAVLRQPADRAYSAFNYYNARGLEPLGDFTEALAAEPARIRANEIPDLRHRMNGCYFANLKPFFELFPRERIHVILYEDWEARPGAVLRETFRFLCVDENAPVEVKRLNVTRRYRSQRLRHVLQGRSRFGRWPEALLPAGFRRVLGRWNESGVPPLPLEIRRTLTESYREDILALQELIGRDLSRWLRHGSP